MTWLTKWRSMIDGATKGPWTSNNTNSLSTWLVYPSEKRLLIEDRSLGPDEPKLYPLKETEGNAKYIAHHNPELMAKVVDLVEAVVPLLGNHEEAWGSCKHCLEDGRGTCAEQVETVLQALKKAIEGDGDVE